MRKRACVFVDGENFRHTICDLFSTFDRREYLPRQARWEELFDWFVSEASPGTERVRTYYYAIQWMDFFPFQLGKLRKDPAKLRRILSRHKPYQQQFAKLTGSQLAERTDQIVAELQEKKRTMQDRFNGWLAIQNGIARKHRAVEFRRAGAIRYDLFEGSLGPEKAVDVKLATDLICLARNYDVAVIVSGDQDYVPAVQVIKNEGRTAINVAFRTRGGRLLPGGAMRLNQETDDSLEVAYTDLAGYLGIAT